MQTAAQTIAFSAPLFVLGKSVILRLPEDASTKLPSRGQVAVTGTISGHEFTAVLEPDGHWGHWLRIDDSLQQVTGLKVGDTADISIAPTKQWPEPVLPADFQQALDEAHDIHDMWAKITPMARWEWIRWVNATREASTRQRRIDASISKMRSGKRRPCCFNLAACTDPELSKNGRLLEA